MGMIALRFSLPWFLPHSFLSHDIFQLQLVYQSCPVLNDVYGKYLHNAEFLYVKTQSILILISLYFRVLLDIVCGEISC